jgi:hypothetical protein
MDRSERRHAWQQRLARQAGGQFSVAAFCKRERVSIASFYYWRRRLRPDDAPRFVPVHLAATTSVEVVLGNGRIVRVPTGADAGWLRELFAAAEGSPC